MAIEGVLPGTKVQSKSIGLEEATSLWRSYQQQSLSLEPLTRTRNRLGETGKRDMWRVLSFDPRTERLLHVESLQIKTLLLTCVFR